MSCVRYATAITDHALGAELPAAAAAHLQACASCRTRLGEQRHRIGAVEVDLREMLQILPSADFERKVRARIGAQPNRRAVAPTSWLAVAAAAALVIAIITGARPERALQDERPLAEGHTVSLPSARAVAPEVVSTTERQRDPVRTPRLPRRTAAAVRRPPSASGTSAPQVLVPPDQARAIARLIELMNQGALRNVVSTNETASSIEFVDLEPAPLTVAPIPVPDVIIDNSRSSGAIGR